MRKRTVLSQLRRLRDSTLGRPSKCLFCEAKPTFVIYNERRKHEQTFACNEHTGPVITTWMPTAHQMNVVRL